jgi:hypothetical protein
VRVIVADDMLPSAARRRKQSHIPLQIERRGSGTKNADSLAGDSYGVRDGSLHMRITHDH